MQLLKKKKLIISLNKVKRNKVIKRIKTKINKNNNKITKIKNKPHLNRKRIIRQTINNKQINNKTIRNKTTKNKVKLRTNLKWLNVQRMSKNEQKCVNKVQVEDVTKVDDSAVLVEVQQEVRDVKAEAEIKNNNKE